MPRILSEGRVHRVKVGETLTLPCKVESLGPYVLMWKKGFRVLTAGKVLVKRDRRIAIMGTNLQIAGKYGGRPTDIPWNWKHAESSKTYWKRVISSLQICRVFPPRCGYSKNGVPFSFSNSIC